jgi:hypothetical protein
MHGLANRAIQRFVIDTYGDGVWSEIASTAALGFETFEPLLVYDRTITDTVIKAASFELGKPREIFLEDLGQYLVSHSNSEALRRLLRFGGATFRSFLESLEDVPGRARLALPDRDFPNIEMHEMGPGHFMIVIQADIDGIGHIVLGAIRGMSDDYGALATIEHRGSFHGTERLTILVHDEGFSEGRQFQLAQPAYL